MALVVGLVTLSIFGGYEVSQVSRPGDEALTTNFFAHEAAFDDLVHMLAVDYPSPVAKGGHAIDLATMDGLETKSERSATYRRLLRQISVADLRYFPASGKLVLVPQRAGESGAPVKFLRLLTSWSTAILRPASHLLLARTWDGHDHR
jgi:hypothetical protein